MQFEELDLLFSNYGYTGLVDKLAQFKPCDNIGQTRDHFHTHHSSLFLIGSIFVTPQQEPIAQVEIAKIASEPSGLDDQTIQKVVGEVKENLFQLNEKSLQLLDEYLGALVNIKKTAEEKEDFKTSSKCLKLLGGAQKAHKRLCSQEGGYQILQIKQFKDSKEPCILKSQVAPCILAVNSIFAKHIDHDLKQIIEMRSKEGDAKRMEEQKTIKEELTQILQSSSGASSSGTSQ